MVDNSESRLDRLEALMTQSGEIILRTTELAQQNSEQINRNGEQINLLQQTMAQLALQAASDRVEFEQHRRTTEAALSKIDRVLDYLMGQQEG